MTACLHKKRYESVFDADGAIHRLADRNQDTELLLAYECSVCAGWHIGHKPRVKWAAAGTHIWFR